MKIYKTENGIVIEHEGNCFIPVHSHSHSQNLEENPVESPVGNDWDKYINRDNLYQLIIKELQDLSPVGKTEWLGSQKIKAPIGSQEVWAAGVTYLRSKAARMEESEGAASFYDKVYEAERPELFFKATAHRVSGTNDYVRIRKDSTWNVPEPELTLLISSSGKIIGYTIGNDMSSRSIEGENPLYLPQAKTYDGCAGLGPCILVTEDPILPNTLISIAIERNNKIIFEGRVSIDQMKRSHTELAEFLFRECSFPYGCFLMTGTCIVPENNFTLQSKDVVRITIENIGTLINTVQ